MTAPFGSTSRPAVIWLLCHHPDTAEADVRVAAAARLQHETGAPVWLFGSRSAQYPVSVESQFRTKLLALGVPLDSVACSSDLTAAISLDTAAEAVNVAAVAAARGVSILYCVSNRLQLLQVRGLLRRASVRLVFVPVPLQDRRWWYVTGRLLLIPLAFLGIGPRFPPLVLLRRVRASWATWPF